MTTRINAKPKITRKNVPPDTRLRLWVKSAGRCEFSGCNEPVWRNNLTLNNGNFGEVAHIIAASEDGPRGNKESADLQIEYSNIMLLCKRCHTEIDTNSEKYPAELLREWKWKHEDRIETLNNGNFGEVAHIIAASEDGPRGNKESADLQIEYSTLCYSVNVVIRRLTLILRNIRQNCCASGNGSMRTGLRSKPSTQRIFINLLSCYSP